MGLRVHTAGALTVCCFRIYIFSCSVIAGSHVQLAELVFLFCCQTILHVELPTHVLHLDRDHWVSAIEHASYAARGTGINLWSSDTS